MANYNTSNTLSSAPNLQAQSSTYKTGVELAAQTTGLKRGRVYEWKLGMTSVPASSDTYVELDISRKTAAGTGTAATPQALDAADPACSATCIINSTVEPTITLNSQLDYAALNQRATAFWQAAPGSELVWPATNLAGLAWRTRSSLYTGNVGLTVKFSE